MDIAAATNSTFNLTNLDAFSQALYQIVLGGDISAFAGQTGELRFTALPQSGIGLLDNVIFSDQAVPEPSAAALILCGAALLWTRFRQNQ